MWLCWTREDKWPLDFLLMACAVSKLGLLCLLLCQEELLLAPRHHLGRSSASAWIPRLFHRALAWLKEFEVLFPSSAIEAWKKNDILLQTVADTYKTLLLV